MNVQTFNGIMNEDFLDLEGGSYDLDYMLHMVELEEAVFLAEQEIEHEIQEATKGELND